MDENKQGLNSEEGFFKTFIDFYPEAIFVHFKGFVIYTNKVGLELLKIKSLDELKNIHIMDINYPDIKSFAKEQPKRSEIINEATPPSLMKKIEISDGSIINVEGFENQLKYEGNELGLFYLKKVFENLEDQNTEIELKNSVILKAIPDLVFIIDKEGIIIDFNIPQDARLYMQRPDEKGEKLEKFVSKNAFGEFLNKIHLTLESKETNFLEYNFPIKDRIETFEARIIYYEKDKVLAIIRNITERKVIEKEQRNIMKIESIELVAGGIAHDFNNILTKIISNINFVKSDEKISEPIQGYLTEMETATYQAKKLTSELLTFSKSGESGKKVESVKEIIEESIAFFLSGSKSKVKTTYENDKLTVEVESGQLEQVISNLIINADQAMPEGGLIDITVDIFEVKNDNMPGIIDGKYVRISIADEGEGVKEKDRIRLFEPYYTTKKTGSGLGLTTSFSIVKKHHGYMQVSDNTPKGAIFRVFFPYIE